MISPITDLGLGLKLGTVFIYMRRPWAFFWLDMVRNSIVSSHQLIETNSGYESKYNV